MVFYSFCRSFQGDVMSKTAQRKEASHLPLPSSPPEKRRSQRRETRLRVDFCPLVPVGQGLIIGGPHRGIAINISTAGLFISDGGLLLMGTTIHLFLRLPDIPANPVACHGKVVRRGTKDQPGYGIRYVLLRDNDACRLEHYVQLLDERARRMASARQESDAQTKPEWWSKPAFAASGGRG